MSDTISSYRWVGLNKQGERATGVIQAIDMKTAQLMLKKMGIDVISLDIKHGFNLSSAKLFEKKQKIKVADILIFTRYLSTLLSAGLPIIQALEIMAHDQENLTMKTLLTTIKNNVSEGKTLAESFAQYPKLFNDLYCNLIKTGEISGTLEKTLLRLERHLERSETLRRKLKKALIYPIAILSIAMIVSLILLLFVVPQFQSMFSSLGADLPGFTMLVVQFSTFLQHDWWLILFVVVSAGFGFKYALHAYPYFSLLVERWSLNLYIVGPVLRKGIIARFSRTLATTFDAGMPIVESMKAMSQVMGSKIYGQAVSKIHDDIINGHALSASMNTTKLFPNMVVQMIAVGEASGTLSDMLNKVADYYEEEVNTIVDNLSSLLEPMIMLILGVIVGGFVIAMYLPIFKMGSLF